MFLNIVHTGKGGAYKVAKFYSETLKSPLLVGPSAMEILSIIFSQKRVNTVTFHSIGYAIRYAFLFKMFSSKTELYLLEHFILSQLVKNEYKTKYRRSKIFIQLKIIELLGVNVLVLDEYCKRNRKLLTGVDSSVIYNPLIKPELKSEKNNNHSYDLVWAGGMSSQKKWDEALNSMVEFARNGYRVAIASYSEPSVSEEKLMRDSGISFYYNFDDWVKLSDTYFFSSNYEGYPLVLIEAITNNLKIIAWCNPSCKYQILKFYDQYLHFSNLSEFNLTDAYENLSKRNSDINKTLELVRRHSETKVKELIVKEFNYES